MPCEMVGTGTQLHQIGHNESMISDYSDESEVERWVEAFEKETARRQSVLPKVDSSGYPPLKPVVGFEYLR